MSLLRMSKSCLYCNGALTPDPANPQWSHCPVCSPAWTNAIADRQALHTFLGMRQQAADPRGRPHRIPG